MDSHVQLALSTRIIEEPFTKGLVDDSQSFARELAAIGYRGICLRPSFLERMGGNDGRALRIDLERLGVAVAMVTPSMAVVRNDVTVSDELLKIREQLDLAVRLGTDLIRVGVSGASDVRRLRRAADEARERGARLAHQVHLNTPFVSSSGCIDMLKEVNRSNFGIIFEPANLLLGGEMEYEKAIGLLRPFIFNVYLQNFVRKWSEGSRLLEHVGVSEVGEIRATRVVERLLELGYDGWITVHSPSIIGRRWQEEARRSFALLSGW